MPAPLSLAAVVACAQVVQGFAENVPPPKAAASKVAAVTVYQGQALVTREVTVPEGEGTVELVVTPLPPASQDNSLFAEGGDGVRVLSTRLRNRVVQEDTRKDVRAKEDLLRTLAADAQKIQRELAAREDDLQYVKKLEGFTGASLASLTEKGRLDSEAVLALSKFIMTTRSEQAKAEVDLRQKLVANTEAADLARKQLGELTSNSGRYERDAVIVVQKTKPEAGTVRLGYMVGAASWTPQYRLRGTAADGPVKLEYLASVTQQTGEPWDDARVTLSTARPSLDSAPPDLLPLKMDLPEADSGPVDAPDEPSRRVAAELDKRIDLPFATETPLEDVIKYIRASTKGPNFPEGISIYVDPVALTEVEKTMASPVVFDVRQIPLRTSLRLLLKQLELTYSIKDGLLTITSDASNERFGAFQSQGGGMGQVPRVGAALNREAATEQSEELRVGDAAGDAQAPPAEKDTPSVAFVIPGRLDIPSRRDSQTIEVARAELPAEFYAKAVPVLTSRVYRLAKLTNKTESVLLPGEATVYVDGAFVGRMTLPLVASGEPFVAGFGVDPQLQVSRRLMKKTRVVQGGNQVYDYEFRLGLRNFRAQPVKFQLWDRLPSPQGEAVGIHLVKTSNELSTDAMYLRTAKMDNLLRWDIDVPPGTVGDKTLYVNYKFRLEYARDLPQPRFVSGGLREGPIGGGAMGGGMGGMGGGMGGGFRSIRPAEAETPR